jgi:preprotein translocase subunit SecE
VSGTRGEAREPRPGVWGRFRRFVEEAWSELRKVTWPTREQTRNLTVLVFVISAVMGLYITAFDLAFTEILRFVTVRR